MPRTLHANHARDDAETATSPAPPANASAGKRWRFRRNLVIYVAHRGGISQRVLADVFDLPRSTVATAIKNLSQFKNPKKFGCLEPPPAVEGAGAGSGK